MADFEQLGQLVNALDFGMVRQRSDAGGRIEITVEQTFKEVPEASVVDWLSTLGLDPPYVVEVHRQQGRITLVRVTSRKARRRSPRRARLKA